MDMDFLDMAGHDLVELDAIFTEEEVWKTIKELHPDRAPGLDGFSAVFYQKAWSTIKNEVMSVLLKLYVGDGQGFDRLNRAHIVLIPNMSNTEELWYYRPISLIHLLAKLFAKVLYLRLAPKLPELVSVNQSAFIVGRCIHDNFLLVQ